MKNKFRFFFVALTGALLLTGCVKDDPDAYFIKLLAEGYTPGSNSKAIVGDAEHGDETVTYWADGDSLWINGYWYEVDVSGKDAVAKGVYMEEASDVYRAVYPKSVHNGGISGDKVTIKVPNKYIYAESKGRQVLDGLPLVAYSSTKPTEKQGLAFKHITAAITVRVKNSYDFDLDLISIDLINDRYQLSGDVTVDLSQCEGEGTPKVAPQLKSGGDRVTVGFLDVKKTVPAGKYVDIQIPILPVGGGEMDPDNPNSIFRIDIAASCKGGRYNYFRVQGAAANVESDGVAMDNSIERAVLGYATARYDREVTVKDLFEKVEKSGEEYYEISTAEEFVALVEAMNEEWQNTSDHPREYYDANYVLTDDINLGGSTIPPMHYYSGDCTFDGDGHKLENLTIDATLKTNDNMQNLCGLFSRPEGDNITVCNLTLENVGLEFGHADLKAIDYDQYYQSAVGGIFGYVGNTYKGGKNQTIVDTITNTRIVNCHVKDLRVKSITKLTANGEKSKEVDEYAGGIVGLVNSDCVIENCTVDGVSIDNSMDDYKGNIFDQFGGAIGRIDVDDNHKYQLSSGAYNENCTKIVIKNFKYNQGNDYLVFNGNLKNVRYGGVIANITRGGKVFMQNVEVIHKVEFNELANDRDACLYAGGILGCDKTSSEWKLHASGYIHIYGVVNNKAFNTYDGKHQVNRYLSCADRPHSKPIDVMYDGTTEYDMTTLEYCNTPDANPSLPGIKIFHTLVYGKDADFQWQYQSFYDRNQKATSDGRPPVNS